MRRPVSLACVVLGLCLLGAGGTACGLEAAPRPFQAGVVGKWHPEAAEVERLIPLFVESLKEEMRVGRQKGSVSMMWLETAGARERLNRMSDDELRSFARGRIAAKEMRFLEDGKAEYQDWPGDTLITATYALQDADLVVKGEDKSPYGFGPYVLRFAIEHGVLVLAERSANGKTTTFESVPKVWARR